MVLDCSGLYGRKKAALAGGQCFGLLSFVDCLRIREYRKLLDFPICSNFGECRRYHS